MRYLRGQMKQLVRAALTFCDSHAHPKPVANVFNTGGIQEPTLASSGEEALSGIPPPTAWGSNKPTKSVRYGLK
jgi:hypothetical protein